MLRGNREVVRGYVWVSALTDIPQYVFIFHFDVETERKKGSVPQLEVV